MTPEALKPATPAPVAKKPAPKKPSAKSKGDINKSAEVRKLAAAMKAKGEKPRPVVIITTLKKQGVVVSSPQVSMVLKQMGFRPRRRRKAGVRAVLKAKPDGRATTKVKIEDLVKAKRIASQLGGIDRALAALQALKGFE